MNRTWLNRARLAGLLLAPALALSACASNTAPVSKGHEAHGGGHGEHAESRDDTKTDVTRAEWSFTPAKPQAASDTALAIRIRDEQGEPVVRFDLNHEKRMHLIIVSQDLTYFDHIHPEYNGGEEQFKIGTRFPVGGNYKLFADYVPAGGGNTTKSAWVSVEGKTQASAPIAADAKLTKTMDGKEVTLSFDRLKAGEDVQLNFRLTDARTKQPIRDLQPYLGAVGHVVILSADAEQYLHVHPTDERAKGPDAKFGTRFPSSGLYRIWGQFQQNGQTFIVSFTVDVP